MAEERCESGRIGLTANELTWGTGSEGSNPSLSAKRSTAREATCDECDQPGGSYLLRSHLAVLCEMRSTDKEPALRRARLGE